jgi:lipid A 4'-phosphatase
LFAAYPLLDLQVADWFFDHEKAKFPLSIKHDWNLVRRVANWVPFLLMLPAIFALLRKLVFPSAPMMIAPSVVLFPYWLLPDRPGPHQQSAAQGDLGQAAAQ